MPRWPMMAVALSIAAALVAGCTVSGTTVDPSADPAVEQVDLTRVPSLGVAPRWERSFGAPATVSLAQDGSLAVSNADGVRVIDARGHDIWTATPDGTATALPQDQLVQGATVYDGHGNALWTDSTGDVLRATGTLDGSRIAALDDAAGQLTLLNGAGQAIGQSAVSAGASAEFADTGALLVDDAARVLLLNPDGSAGPSFPTGANAPPRHLEPAHRAQWLAVTTGGGDNTTYLFGLDGTPIWQRPAPSGGPASLVVAPDDRSLVVFRPGGSGIEDLSAASGQAVWRLLLGGGVQSAAFLPDGRLMVDLATASGQQLLVLRGDGSVAGQQRLSGQKVYLAGPARALVTLAQSDGVAQIRWYALSGGA